MSSGNGNDNGNGKDNGNGNGPAHFLSSASQLKQWRLICKRLLFKAPQPAFAIKLVVNVVADVSPYSYAHAHAYLFDFLFSAL